MTGLRAVAGLFVLAVLGAGSIAGLALARGDGGVAYASQASPDAAAVTFEVDDVTLREWEVDAAANREEVTGRLLLDGEPVQGARVAVDGYLLPEPTDQDGQFTYPADATVNQRHVLTVRDVEDATVGGDEPDDEASSALLEAQGAFNVAYQVSDLETKQTDAGIQVTGRLSINDRPPQAPFLFAYRVRGVVTGPDGQPLPDHVVVWRSPDFETWTIDRTDEAGAYEMFLWPNSKTVEEGAFRVIVAEGNQVWEPAEDPGGVTFQPLSSAVVDIQVPASEDEPLGLPAEASPEPGSFWYALLVGVTAEDGSMVQPVEGHWLDEDGAFSLTLPDDLSGSTVSLWLWNGDFYSVDDVQPGGVVEDEVWPDQELPARVPQGVVTVDLP